MKADLYERPQSRRIKLASANAQNRAATSQKAEDYFRRGKEQQAASSLDKAIESYMRAVAFNPNYFQAYCNMGYCYRALGRYAEAKRCYLTALAINSADTISHYNLANLYRINGQNELAIGEYSFVIEAADTSSPLYLNSLINLGICFKNEGHIEQAITNYRKVLAIDPQEQDAAFNLAICLLNSIETKNSSAFHKFYHERALEAQVLFRQVDQRTGNLMAKLSLSKISVFLDSSTANVQRSLDELRGLLQHSDCDIADELNQQIAHCLKLAKDYEQSSRLYEGSIKNLVRRKSAQKPAEPSKIDNIFETFEPDRPVDYGAEMFLTEDEGVRLIESGQLRQAEERIGELSDDDLLKHSLRLMLSLKRGEDEERFLHQALRIYQAHFSKGEAELPFHKLSLETHKALGKLLSLNGRFEESVRHYEFISENLADRRACASAKLYTELGEGFEETGNLSKALEEYKRAVEIEPDNYTLAYNMGCCLYENGNCAEAAQYFQNILGRLDKDASFNPETRELYRTDCMILLALALEPGSAKLEAAAKAFAQLQLLKAHQQSHLELLEDNLLHFLIQAAELFEKQLSATGRQDDSFRATADTLLAIYAFLLQLENCPDANEIIVNSGNIYYQLERYASAALAYEQAGRSQLVPQVNQALAYAHLIEPMAAMRHIHLACAEKDRDASSFFCREVLEWVYYRERGGEWSRFLPNVKWDMYYERQEFGLALIDKLTELLNEPSFEPEPARLRETLLRLVKDSGSFRFKQAHKNQKFEKVQEIIRQYDLKSDLPCSNILSPAVLKLCFSKSNAIEQDFAKLTQLLRQLQPTGREAEFCETAVYLLIYYNQGEYQKILEQIEKHTRKRRQKASIQTASRQNQELYSIYSDFKNVRDLVATFKEWETILEERVSEITQTLERHYYGGDILRPLEYDYNFPRHSTLLESDETLEKVMYIAKEALRYSLSLSFRGQNVEEMRQDMIKQFQSNFNQFLQKGNRQPITLSDHFLPLTIHSAHRNKAECQLFLDQLASATSSPPVTIGDCDELDLVVDRLVRVRCRWNNPYQIGQILEEVLESMLDSPIFIVNQAIIFLEKSRKALASDSPEARHFLSLDSTLHF